jgi:hypothetical protein
MPVPTEMLCAVMALMAVSLAVGEQTDRSAAPAFGAQLRLVARAMAALLKVPVASDSDTHQGHPCVALSISREKTAADTSEKNDTPERKKRFFAWKRVFSPVASAVPVGMQIPTGD